MEEARSDAAAELRILALVMATATLVGIVLSASQPLLSLVLDRHGVSSDLIGLNAAAGGLGIFLVAPFIPRLLGMGASRAMLIGVATTGLTFVLLPLHIDLWLWFALRLLQSAGLALLFIMSESAVNSIVTEERRGRVMGIYGTLFSVGYTAGPALIVLVGSEGLAPFLACAGILAVGGIVTVFLSPIDALLKDGADHRLEIVSKLRSTPFVFATGLVFAIMENGHFTLLVLWGLDGGLVEQEAGLLLMTLIAGNILFQYPVGWIGDRIGRVRTVVVTALVAVLGHVLMNGALAAGWPIWPVLLLTGGAIGSLYSCGLSLLGRTYGREQVAGANTVYIMMIQVGVSIGPLVGGTAMQMFGAWTLPWTLAGAALLLALSRSGVLLPGRTGREG
ncbi:MAG TPA: MFS transporter [Geminicoccus sp.]|jgi:MFS family permease|uniref:MFS transporter n=1 Tax=Geminicoccus sp. TaxID=2024832 RepID=UPI002E33174C|nr:MFS transporter [Geminicoccus sp.]HEX2527390.1 MFS transporter [Geminicoccus sp.]